MQNELIIIFERKSYMRSKINKFVSFIKVEKCVR